MNKYLWVSMESPDYQRCKRILVFRFHQKGRWFKVAKWFGPNKFERFLENHLNVDVSY